MMTVERYLQSEVHCLESKQHQNEKCLIHILGLINYQCTLLQRNADHFMWGKCYVSVFLNGFSQHELYGIVPFLFRF